MLDFNQYIHHKSSQTLHIGPINDSVTYCFGKDTHELRELMCEHGQHGSEGAKARCEEDEEGELFLRVHGHLVESCSNRRRGGEGGGGQCTMNPDEQKKKKNGWPFNRMVAVVWVLLTRQQFPVCCFCASWVRVKQVTLF